MYDADLNLLLGVKWRSLIHHCTDHSLLNSGQFGGLPGRDAMTPIFLEEFQWEISRASRRSLVRINFDASSCYDRVIPSIASFATRSYGQHHALCFIHGTFLQQAKYVLKTKLGLSDEEYSRYRLHPIYGTGQGSANSPVIWALICSRLLDAQAARAYGATFVSKNHSARKTMGCYKSPSDNFKKSLAHIAATAKAKSDAVLHNFITAKRVHRFYYSVFLPSVT
jgi:hypothetical protein